MCKPYTMSGLAELLPRLPFPTPFPAEPSWHSACGSFSATTKCSRKLCSRRAHYETFYYPMDNDAGNGRRAWSARHWLRAHDAGTATATARAACAAISGAATRSAATATRTTAATAGAAAFGRHTAAADHIGNAAGEVRPGRVAAGTSAPGAGGVQQHQRDIPPEGEPRRAGGHEKASGGARDRRLAGRQRADRARSRSALQDELGYRGRGDR